MRKKTTIILTTILCIVMLSACSQTTNTADADKIIWRLSHEESAGSMQDMYAMKFKELIVPKAAPWMPRPQGTMKI